MQEVDPSPLLSSSRSSSPMGSLRMKQLLWGATLVLLLIIMGLLAYDVHLSRNIQTTTSTTPTTDTTGYGAGITSAMDFSADPCTDFYQYSCGSLINSIKLPSGSDMYIPVFSQVQYDNYVTLSDIVTDQWPLIGDLYTSCMAGSDYLNNDTATSLVNLISTIQGVTSTSPASLFPVLASLHRKGVQAFFSPSLQENIFQQGSLMNLLLYEATLPVTSKNSAAVANVIFRAVSAYDPSITQGRATNVANFEATLNANFVEPEEYVDLLVNMTWQSFNSLAGVDYNIYAQGLGIQVSDSDTVIIATPDYIKSLSPYFGSSGNLQTIIDYLVWRTVYSFVYQFPVVGSSLSIVKSALNQPIRKGLQTVRHSVVNQEMLRPHLLASATFTEQQISCIDAVDTLLGDYLGLIFTIKVLDNDVINDIRTVTGGIQNSFRNNLASLSWIDSPSRTQAVDKLNNILQIIGHPNKLDRYRGLELDSAHFLNNIIAINERVFDDTMSNLGSPYNRSDSEFPATIVNAFYNPEANTINFPAGILESPMFSSSFPKLMQYARMGYVIGHETTHGFDNNGRLWNAQGVFQPIMDDASSIEFNTRAQCIVDQYNKFEPLPGYFVNGQQTLGENIADLGGVKNAFGAYKAWVQANGTANLQLTAKSPIVPQLTNQQLFFVVMGQTWCTKATSAGIQDQLLNDVHSPSQYRVNGPLANLQAFADAFSCAKGKPMNPSTRCELW